MKFINNKHHTSPFKVFIAICVGAFIGASIITADYLLNLYYTLGSNHFHEFGLKKGASIFLMSWVIWAVCILIFGGPAWLFLHWRGYRTFLSAICMAAIIAFTINLMFATGFFTGHKSGSFSYFAQGGQQWEDGIITEFGLKIAFKSSFERAIQGILIAFAIWFVAYKAFNRNTAKLID